MTAESFAAYADDRSEVRFTAWLRDCSEPAWTQAIEHRFTRELAAGTLDDAVFRRYLVQDYAFIGTLTGAFGYAVGQAPTMEAKRELTNFLSTLTAEENDYFQRSFDALGVKTENRSDPRLTNVTESFGDLLVRAAHEGDFEETLAVLLPVEWVYLTWATTVTDTPEPFYFREWIELHNDPAFETFVQWLRDELDVRGPELSPRRQDRIERLFRRAVTLEFDFFEMAYG